MKKILTLVFVSALGGILTLGGYKLFVEDTPETVVTEVNEPQLPVYIPTTTTPTKTTSALLNPNIEQPNLVDAANKTIDAVVHVKNTKVTRGPQSMADLFYGRYSEKKQLAGAGSGVIISPDGYIITNNHVIKGAAEIDITLNNNKTYDATLIGTDEKTDIALLKVEAENELPFVAFGDSDATQIGEWVLAVGNPFNLTSTVTAGIISAKSRDLSGGQSFIQTDAAVNPGNSGGALVNTNGDLVGINTAITSQTGSYIGYSFAVPSNIARKIVEDIVEFGDVQNVMLGITTLNSNSPEAKEKGLNQIEGVYISGIEEDSGAEQAGLQSGDVIKRLDNVEITKFSELSGYLKTKSPNDVVNVEVQRGNNIKTVPVVLTKKKLNYTEFMNIEVMDIPERYKTEYPELADGGVIIREIENAWLYNKVGLRKNYVITGINDTKIETRKDIMALKEKYGDNFMENLNRIEYLDRNLNKKETIFR